MEPILANTLYTEKTPGPDGAFEYRAWICVPLAEIATCYSLERPMNISELSAVMEPDALISKLPEETSCVPITDAELIASGRCKTIVRW